MTVDLERWADTPFGVFGTLTVGTQHWYTLEDDWRNNERSVSCIPEGAYTLTKVLHHGILPTYEIGPVPGRSHIHIHPGTTEEDTEGCVLLGDRLGSVNVADEDVSPHRNMNKWCVLDSRKAHAAFMAALVNQNRIPIVVRWRTR